MHSQELFEDSAGSPEEKGEDNSKLSEPKLKTCPFCGADAVSHPHSKPMITCSNTECRMQGTYIYVRDWQQRYPPMESKYAELIMAVGKKYEGETRHDTALRYIRQAESETGATAAATNGT